MSGTVLVTAFLRNDAQLLVCRRDDRSVSGDDWDGLSSPQDDADVVPAALQAVDSIAGIDPAACSVVRTVDRPIEPATDGNITAVYPVLIDTDTRDLTVDSSVEAYDWIHAPNIHRRATVPWLWDAYQRVAPTVRLITADDEHGATWLSIRALEVLRDRAGQLAETAPEEGIDELQDLGDRLREARPSMAVLHNRVNRVLAEAATPAGVEEAAITELQTALTADTEAAMTAAELLDGQTVLTLSRSGTVIHALRSAGVETIHVLTSHPGGEGIHVAEQLGTDNRVVLHADAAVAHVLAEADIDLLLVGADTVLPDGSVINKTGTRTAAVAAACADIPVYVAAAADKITTRQTVNLEVGDRSTVYNGDAPIDVRNPLFDITPSDCIEAYATDRGVLSTADIRSLAADLQDTQQ